MEKIEGTPDSYLVKNFIPFDPLNYIDVISGLEREISFAGIPSLNGKPKAVFQADTYADDSYYYLRCPSIKPEELTSMVPTVNVVRNQLTNITGANCNIAKVLKYQGTDQLKNHADKIIDLKERSNIYTIRFGAQRSILLRNKIDGREILIEIPHNCLFVLGWETNQQWTHGIPKSEVIGTTYSIVLRESVTYLHKKTLKVWGPRTKYLTVDDLLKNLTDPTTNPLPHEIFERWHVENKIPVSLDHYSFFF